MKKHKILIVEDNYLVYDYYRKLLQKKNYEVGPYIDNYDEALEAILKFLPDLILIDIQLSDSSILDGIALGKYLTENSNIPFIYLTISKDDHTVKRAKLTEPADYIIKTEQVNEDQFYNDIFMALPSKGLKKKTYGLKKLKFYIPDKNTRRLEVLIDLNEIVWIGGPTESKQKNKIIIQTHTEEYIVRDTLDNLESKLPKDRFS